MRSAYVVRAKKFQQFSSLDVVFSSLEVRISSLAIQQNKVKTVLSLLTLYIGMQKMPIPGAQARRGGAPSHRAGDPPPTDGLGSFCLPTSREGSIPSRLVKGGPGGFSEPVVLVDNR